MRASIQALRGAAARLSAAPAARAGARPRPISLAPHEALVAWLIALPDGADYAVCARAALETLPWAGPGQPALAELRRLLDAVAAQGGAADIARHAAALRRRRPRRADG